MGVDLRIIPAYHGNADFSCTALECSRDYNFFDHLKLIQEKHGRDVSRKGFTGYMGDNFKKQDEDAYGNVLQSVQAKNLKRLDLFNDCPTNRAVLAYIKQLDDDHECFLYWH